MISAVLIWEGCGNYAIDSMEVILSTGIILGTMQGNIIIAVLLVFCDHKTSK